MYYITSEANKPTLLYKYKRKYKKKKLENSKTYDESTTIVGII